MPDGQEEVLNSFSSLQNCPPLRLASTYNDIARTKNLLWLDGSDRLGIIILQHLMRINRVIISSCCAAKLEESHDIADSLSIGNFQNKRAPEAAAAIEHLEASVD